MNQELEDELVEAEEQDMLLGKLKNKSLQKQMQQMTVKSGGLYWPDPDANTYNDIRHKNNKSK